MKKNKYGATALLAGVLLLSLNACSGNGAEEIADVEQQAGASRVTLIEATINVSETNTLQMQLEATLGENAVKVQKLVLTGEIRMVDMHYIRESLLDLQEVDMSAVTIKASYFRTPNGSDYYVSDNEICMSLFELHTALKTLQLPISTQRISDFACNRTSLQTIEIPASVTSLGLAVCGGNAELTSVTFAAQPTNKTIPQEMCRDCPRLTTIDLTGSNVTTVGLGAFAGCVSLTDYTPFANIIAFEDRYFNGHYGAFEGCGFTSVDLSNIETLGGYAFANCASLESVTFSNTLTSIGRCAFMGTALTSVELPAGITHLYESIFKNTPLTTLTIPSSVTSIVGSIVPGCNQLTGLFWESTASVPDEYLPNCFLYLTTQNGVAPAFGPNWKNVVIDGVAESIEFNFLQQNADTPPFRCPQAFTAKKISFTRDFNNWQNTVIGASSGWYTITLPFTPTSITHPEKGELAPFGSGVEDAKPFWLRQLTAEGFADVTTIEPNVSYILSLPYNPEMYADEYNIRGKVTFSAENVQIPVTPDALPASDGPTFQLCPTYQYVPMRGNVYALNTDYWVEDYNYGSVFVRSAQEVYPFEAYAVVPSSAAPAVLSLDFRSANSRAAGVRNTTGIPQIGDK